jgi:hypothetical protein
MLTSQGTTESLRAIGRLDINQLNYKQPGSNTTPESIELAYPNACGYHQDKLRGEQPKGPKIT